MLIFCYVYRTIVKEHIPKRHLNFEEPILTDKVFDDTTNRINGQRSQQRMQTENYLYGKSHNPADDLQKVGKKTKIREAQI